MGRRYERPGAAARAAAARRPETDEDRAQAAWKALDRGEDPTDGPDAHGRPPIAEPVGAAAPAPRTGALRRL